MKITLCVAVKLNVSLRVIGSLQIPCRFFSNPASMAEISDQVLGVERQFSHPSPIPVNSLSIFLKIYLYQSSLMNFCQVQPIKEEGNSRLPSNSDIESILTAEVQLGERLASKFAPFLPSLGP